MTSPILITCSSTYLHLLFLDFSLLLIELGARLLGVQLGCIQLGDSKALIVWHLVWISYRCLSHWLESVLFGYLDGGLLVGLLVIGLGWLPSDYARLGACCGCWLRFGGLGFGRGYTLGSKHGVGSHRFHCEDRTTRCKRWTRLSCLLLWNGFEFWFDWHLGWTHKDAVVGCLWWLSCKTWVCILHISRCCSSRCRWCFCGSGFTRGHMGWWGLTCTGFGGCCWLFSCGSCLGVQWCWLFRQNGLWLSSCRID